MRLLREKRVDLGVAIVWFEATEEERLPEDVEEVLGKDAALGSVELL